MLTDSYKAPLSEEIKKSFNKLISLISNLAPSHRLAKNIKGTGGQVSIADLIAYQIGWGKLLISWYECGLKGKIPQMPGEGFSKWDYVGLAEHFYKKYHFDGDKKQDLEFYETIKKLLMITEQEYQNKNLDKEGVWDWCTLASGKQWPLSKWIKINTIAPYARAISLISKTSKKF